MKLNYEQWGRIFFVETRENLSVETMKVFIETTEWGTLGKNREHDSHVQVLLKDLSTEHLEMILITQRQIPRHYTMIILTILKERYKNEEV